MTEITRRKLLGTTAALPVVAALPLPVQAAPKVWVEWEFDANIGCNTLALKSNFEGKIPIEMAYRAYSKCLGATVESEVGATWRS